MSTSEILCSRCGTPFPQEKGKPSVTCVVCGQLRPDLDMTLEDDDDVSGVFGAGAGPASTTPAKAPLAPAAPAALRSRVLTPQNLATSAPSPATIDRPYVSMSEDLGQHRMEVRRTDSLSERIGPVILVVAPLAAGMAGALKMLAIVEDFSAGAWYAVGTVFLALLIGSLFAGLILSGLFYVVRARWNVLLRTLFLAAAVAVAYLGVREVPSHVKVQQNDLPGIVFGR